MVTVSSVAAFFSGGWGVPVYILCLDLPVCGYIAKVDCVEHCDKFWYWLQSKGINSNRSGIVNAIAEKVNTWIPGEEDPFRRVDFVF